MSELRYQLLIAWLTLRVWWTHPVVRPLRAPAAAAAVMLALIPATWWGVPGV